MIEGFKIEKTPAVKPKNSIEGHSIEELKKGFDENERRFLRLANKSGEVMSDTEIDKAINKVIKPKKDIILPEEEVVIPKTRKEAGIALDSTTIRLRKVQEGLGRTLEEAIKRRKEGK